MCFTYSFTFKCLSLYIHIIFKNLVASDVSRFQKLKSRTKFLFLNFCLKIQNIKTEFNQDFKQKIESESKQHLDFIYLLCI